jgi:hypothetical protein
MSIEIWGLVGWLWAAVNAFMWFDARRRWLASENVTIRADRPVPVCVTKDADGRHIHVQNGP